MDECWDMVKEFHRAFSVPAPDAQKALTPERAKKRYTWMLEEINEFLEADNIYDQADAMIDLIYFALGTMVEMGVKPKKLFSIVHNANMTKLWQDGAPHYNKDGKVIKPPGWVDPYPLIKQEIDEKSP